MSKSDLSLSLGEPADESDWRALVDKGLKGAGWERLTTKSADGLAIAPLYREPDCATATDVSGLPGAAPFIRGATMRDTAAPWAIRQLFDHPDPERANRDILADLEGGVSSLELKLDPTGAAGIMVRAASDLDLLLADVIPEAAPIALDAEGIDAAQMLAAKLKGVAAAGTAFNVDPLGALMRGGAIGGDEMQNAARFARTVADSMPAATALRVDSRPVHEAGGSEAQEIAAALACGIAYVRALQTDGARAADAARTLLFTLSVGPDVLVEASKLRALRLCWARVMEAFGAEAEARAARIHAVTSRRMLTRYDAYGNILRTTTAAFAATIGGAEAITTLPFTDALGGATPFARRVARNTQHVLLEESHAGQVTDPAGGAWYVEKLTRELAEKAWAILQQVEASGGIVAALQNGLVQRLTSEARATRQRAIATRRESITGVTDYPLLGAAAPAFEVRERRAIQTAAPKRDISAEPLIAIRWAEAFEKLRDKAEAQQMRPSVFFANLGPLADFSVRALWAQSLFAVAGVGALGGEEAHATLEALVETFKASRVRVALITGTDACYADHAANAARALKGAGADWVVLAGKPGEREAALREAGVDQFVFAGQDALQELGTLHTALGLR